MRDSGDAIGARGVYSRQDGACSMSSEGFDKSTIINSFLDEVSAYIPEIEAHLDRLQIAPDDGEAVEEAYRRTHTIAGSAAMMDFHGLAHIAQGMEVILDGALEQQATLDAPTVALLRRSCGRLDASGAHDSHRR